MLLLLPKKHEIGNGKWQIAHSQTNFIGAKEVL